MYSLLGHNYAFVFDNLNLLNLMLEHRFFLVNGGYSDWMNQGNCTADCGGGTQQQIRQCNNPPPQQPFGMPCNSSEPTVRQNNCNPQTCGVGMQIKSFEQKSFEHLIPPSSAK